jgi:hypothetical protein
MTTDYKFAAWAQQTEKEIAQGLIASDGTTIEWNGRALAEMTDDELRNIFEEVRNIPATGFAQIVKAYREAQRAIQMELKSRGIIVHPFIRAVEPC